MSEPLFRALILGLIAVVVVGLIFRQRRRRTVPPVPTSRPDLGEGVHFFASETCSPCSAARAALESVYGDRFNEISYEDDPARFGEFGIPSVPTVMVLDSTGRGLVWTGVPRARDLPRL